VRSEARSAARGIVVLLAMAACATAAADTSATRALADAARDRDAKAVRTLLRTSVDVNAPTVDGTPALHWAVRNEDFDSAQRLLRAGADVNLANRYGVLPLHLAIQNGDARIVHLLLKAGANPSSSTAAGETSLMLAARTGDVEIITALLTAGAVVDERDMEFEQTPLMLAVRSGHGDAVQLFIARGADVNARTRTGETPAFRSPATNSGSKGAGIVRGGWPERGERDPTPGAKTPLLYAAREGHVEIAKHLLNAGAKIEIPDADGVTPLLMAIVNNHLPLAHLLVEQGANVNATDWYGQTPLWATVDIRNLDVAGPTRDNGVNRDEALGVIKTLLGRGADPNARTRESPPQRRWITRLGSLSWVDFTGQTPFLRAALAGDVTVMRLLLEHEADPNITTFNGTTPLMAAAGINWTVSQTFDEGPATLLEAVKLALAQGNDVNAANAMGLRAIHGAANRGSDEIVQLLVQAGAALDVPDKEGRTPLTWARGVFLATHPPEAKPKTIALLEQLRRTQVVTTEN
jgi:ankyrin repeat protein